MKLAPHALLLASLGTGCDSGAPAPAPTAPFGVDAYEIVDVQLDDTRWIYDLAPESWGPDYIRFELAREDKRATAREAFLVIPVARIRVLSAPRLDSAGEPVVANQVDAARAELDALMQGYIDD